MSLTPEGGLLLEFAPLRYCRSCKRGKPHCAFNSGCAWCAECEKERHRRRHLANPELARARANAWRLAHPERAAASVAAWRSANREKARLRARQYAKENADKLAAATQRYEQRFPERGLALAAVTNALKRGRLERLPCWICGDTNVEGHHPSYAEDARLDVVWLCRSHHRQLHANFAPAHG